MGWFKTKNTVETTRKQTSYSAPKQTTGRTTATVTSPRVQTPVPKSTSAFERAPITTEEAGLMVVDQPPNRVEEDAYDTSSQASPDFSREGDLTYVEGGTTKQNHLNSLFNGHLMKWKFEAEEGSGFIRIPAFFGGLGLIGTAIAALILDESTWTASFIVMSVCVILMGIFILILDGRFLASNPLSARAHLRNVLTRNFNIFRFLWGRALLYMAAGILSVAQVKLLTMISGSVMILIGFIALFVGIYASRKFAALRNSLADESFLLLVFSNYDSDGDGYVSPNEFASLIQDLGMELDDRYTLKAFNVMDSDNDRRVSFDEFSHWWASGYIERGRKRFDAGDEDYHRMA